MRNVFILISVALVFVFYITHNPATAEVSDKKLRQIINDRPEEDKARDQYRLPYETIKFFEFEEGQTIVDVHSGSWYGSIFFPILGPTGHYIGAEISPNIYDRNRENFQVERWRTVATGWYADEERAKWSDTQPQFTFLWQGEAPEELRGTVDRYVFFRVLHHSARLGEKEQKAILKEAFELLKEEGIAAVIQHKAPKSHSDEWANGDNGYMKRSRVIELFTSVGFILEAESEMHRNLKDQPRDKTEDHPGDRVWRLPPTSLKPDGEKFLNVGESDRMTLKFRKPKT